MSSGQAYAAAAKPLALKPTKALIPYPVLGHLTLGRGHTSVPQ